MYYAYNFAHLFSIVLIVLKIQNLVFISKSTKCFFLYEYYILIVNTALSLFEN